MWCIIVLWWIRFNYTSLVLYYTAFVPHWCIPIYSTALVCLHILIQIIRHWRTHVQLYIPKLQGTVVITIYIVLNWCIQIYTGLLWFIRLCVHKYSGLFKRYTVYCIALMYSHILDCPDVFIYFILYNCIRIYCTAVEYSHFL
jgi:hypothetical protein